MPPSLTVRPATQPDVPALPSLSLASFADDPITGYLSCDVAPAALLAYQVKRYERRVEDGGVFVVDEGDEGNGGGGDGEIVALSRWQCPHTPATAEQKAERDKNSPPPPPKPEGWNTALEEDFFGLLDERSEKWVDERRDFYLLNLSVHPAHQRRGIGSLLLRHGLAIADATAGAKTYLESSAKGEALYLRHGFRQVDEVSIDMGRYGGCGVQVGRCMVREAAGGGGVVL